MFKFCSIIHPSLIREFKKSTFLSFNEVSCLVKMIYCSDDAWWTHAVMVNVTDLHERSIEQLLVKVS